MKHLVSQSVVAQIFKSALEIQSWLRISHLVAGGILVGDEGSACKIMSSNGFWQTDLSPHGLLAVTSVLTD